MNSYILYEWQYGNIYHNFILFFIYFFKQSFLFFINLFYLFIFGCVGSSLLCTGFLQLRRKGATLRCGARASHCGGFFCCGARALVVWASIVVAHGLQQLWCMGLVAPQHVGSSRTRAPTRVPCIGRRILNHCATSEVPQFSPNNATSSSLF